MDRRHLAAALYGVFAVPIVAVAQIPTPEEFAERAEASQKAPLFQSFEPLEITLRTDIQWLLEERNDSVEVEGTATFVDLDGSETTKPVDVRTRGLFRMDKVNCNFPPLRLDFPRSQMEGTVFEGQNRLKLVTPCNDDEDEHQTYIYKEYLAYRALNVLSPYGHRVRLVEITYEDIEGDYDTRTKIGFVVESDERMAERNRATHMDVAGLMPTMADGPQSVFVAVFNYMIGNLDWSPVYMHNVKLIRTEDAKFVTVPYDFDFSGIVNASYATPPPQIAQETGIRRVTQRMYRGFCRAELQHEPIAALFTSKRQQLEQLYTSFPLLEDDDAAEALDYLEDFWEVLEDPGEFEDEIVEACRDPDTGR
jgi:hypothetical protein